MNSLKNLSKRQLSACIHPYEIKDIIYPKIFY